MPIYLLSIGHFCFFRFIPLPATKSGCISKHIQQRGVRTRAICPERNRERSPELAQPKDVFPDLSRINLQIRTVSTQTIEHYNAARFGTQLRLGEIAHHDLSKTSRTSLTQLVMTISPPAFSSNCGLILVRLDDKDARTPLYQRTSTPTRLPFQYIANFNDNSVVCGSSRYETANDFPRPALLPRVFILTRTAVDAGNP